MRAAVLSALLLCFCLFTGTKFSYSGTDKNEVTVSSQKIISSHQGYTTQPPVGISVRKNIKVSDNREDFISIEDEDDLIVTRKFSVPVKYILLPDYNQLLVTFYNFPNNRLPFCTHFSYTSSYKYILQRVLRI
jgi:hypothetical protein